MKKLILLLALALCLVPNFVIGGTARLEHNVDELLFYCNFSNYTNQAYQYTLWYGGANLTSGYAFTNGTTTLLFENATTWNDMTGNWNAVYPASNVVDNNWSSFGSVNGVAVSYINMSYHIALHNTDPTITWKGYNEWGGNITFDLLNGSKGENIWVRLGSNYLGGNQAVGTVFVLNLSDRTLVNMYSSGIRVGPPYAHRWYEEQITVNYSVSSYSPGIEINVLNYTYPVYEEPFILGCRAINISHVNASPSEWVNSSPLSFPGNLTIYNEITREAITDPLTVEIINLDSGDSSSYTTTNGSVIAFVRSIGSSLLIKYEGDGYFPRDYYTTEFYHNNISLFLLNQSGNRIIHTLYDEYGDESVNVTIHQLRQYGGEYITVAMARSNFEGASVLSAELYDINYKLIYYDTEGNLVRITEPSPFLSETTEDQAIFGEDVYYSWRNIDNTYSNVSFYNDSGVIKARFIYSNADGLIRDGCLVVRRLKADGLSTICNNCTSSSSATLTCVIDHTIDGEYQAFGLLDTNTTGSWYTQGTATWIVTHPFRFGQEGVFLSLLIVGSLGLMGVATIAGSAILLLLGLLIPLSLSLVAGFSFGLYVWIAVLVFVILFMLRKVSR